MHGVHIKIFRNISNKPKLHVIRNVSMMNIYCKKRKFLRTGLYNSILSRTKGLELHRNVQYGSYNLFVGSKTLPLRG